MATPTSPEKLVRGNAALAKMLHVCRTTVNEWANRGYLDKAIKIRVGKVIIYDFDLAVECLHPDNIKKVEMKRRWKRV